MKQLLLGVAFTVLMSNLFAAEALPLDSDFKQSALKVFRNSAGVDVRDVIHVLEPWIVQDCFGSEPDQRVRAQLVCMSEIHRITRETYSDFETLDPWDFIGKHTLIAEIWSLRRFAIDFQFSKAPSSEGVAEILTLFWTRVELLTRWFHKVCLDAGQDCEIWQEYFERETFSKGFVRPKDQIHTPESAYELIVEYLEGIKDSEPRDEAYIQLLKDVEQAKAAAEGGNVMSLIKKEVEAIRDAAIDLDQQRADEGLKKLEELVKQLEMSEAAQQ